MLRHLATSTVKVLVAGVFALTVIYSALAPSHTVAAPLLSSRFDRMSNPRAGETSIHNIGMTINEVSTVLGSVEITFCSNSPILGDVCTAPPGFDALTATYQNEVGNSGFSIHPNSTANRIILTRFPILPTSTNFSFELAGVTNPSVPGSHYLRLQTYATEDATGTATEEGGIAISISSGFDVSAEVPPYLKFCAGATITGYDCASATSFLLDLGDFSTQETSTASSQFVVATNAGSGFNVTMAGTTLTSGNNIIPGVNNASSSVGTSQFGVNLRANTNPVIGIEPVGPGAALVRPNYNIPNVFRFVPNESIVHGTGTTDNRKFTMSFITNISNNQPAGVYATTLSFICLANF